MGLYLWEEVVEFCALKQEVPLNLTYQLMHFYTQ